MSARESTGVLTPFEAEHLVSRLRIFNLELIGSSDWMRQHEALEKLNIQAHHSAITKHDEFVVETIVTQQKMSVLVHELLAIEAWKESVFPHLAPKLSPLAALKAYIVLYHEATLCNLFEVLLFHESACEAADEALAELVDYCVRKLIGLNCGKFAPSAAADVKKDLEDEGPKRLVRQAEDMNFNIAVCAVAMLRFITDHVASLPVSIVARLLDTHDVIQLLVPLVERPPWTRRTAKGVLEKFSEQKWVEKPSDEALKLTQTEAQIWLALYNLLMDNSCRSRYQYTSHRKEAVIKLRRHLTEPLMDQLPVLRPFLRMVEELSLVDPPPPTQSPLVVIEQMSDMREQLISGIDGAALVEGLIAGPFANNPAALQKDMKSLAGTYDLDNYEDVLDLPKCAAPGCGKDATQRCSRCKCEWYCGRECQVKCWKAHKAMCDILAADAALKAKEQAKTAAAIEEID